MTEVVVATKNPDKIPEIEAMLGAVLSDWVIIRGLDWPDVEETGSTLEENALLKGLSPFILIALFVIHVWTDDS